MILSICGPFWFLYFIVMLSFLSLWYIETMFLFIIVFKLDKLILGVYRIGSVAAVCDDLRIISVVLIGWLWLDYWVGW